MSPMLGLSLLNTEFFFWSGVAFTLVIYHDFLSRILAYPFSAGRRAMKSQEKESYRVRAI